MPQGRQAPTFNAVSQLTPVARPVDTFAGAPVSPFSQLASALSDLNPALNNYIAQEGKKVDAADFQAGQTAYMKARTGLKEAVDKGTIPAGFSPGFQRGYQQGQLRVMGLDYDQQLRSAYAQSDAASSSDPNAYQNFVQDFTAKYMQDKDIAGFHPLDVGEAFTPAVDQSQRSLNAYHAQQQAQTIEDNWQANTQAEISTTIDNAVANGFTPDQVGEAVNGVVTKAMANGWHDKSTFNKNVVELVAAKALGANNPSILDTLKHIPAGPGSVLGNTTYARDKALETTQRIQNQARADQQWSWAQEDRIYTVEAHKWAQAEHQHTLNDWAQEKSAGTLMRSMVARAIEDPTQDFTKDSVTLAGLDKDGSAARAFMGFRQSMLDQKNNGADNPNAVNGMYQDMLAHPTTFNPARIVQAHADGSISMKTMQSMLDDQRRFALDGQSPLLNDTVYKTLRAGVEKAFNGDPDSFDVTKVAQTTKALMDFQRHAMDYLAKHRDDLDQNMFYTEMQKYQQHLVKPLLDAEAPAPRGANGKPAPAQNKPQAQKPSSNPFAQSGMSR